jgi:hypothetical protein
MPDCLSALLTDLVHRQDEGLNPSVANRVAVAVAVSAPTGSSSLPDDEKEHPPFVLKLVLTKSCSEVIAGDILR